MIDSQLFSDRRDSFLAKLGDKAAIIPAATMVTHHADCEYPFRQNSDFWYLTGFDEPNAVALFLPHKPKGKRFVLFVEPKEPSLEVWTGAKVGVEGAIKHFHADISHPIDQLHSLLPDYLKGASSIAFRVGKYPEIEKIVLKVLSDQLDRVSRSGENPLSLFAPCPLLHDLRLIKTPEEILRIREASRISSEAHELARGIAKPGVSERYIQGVIENHFLQEGARGSAYPSIVAAGDNACVLHYISNNDSLSEGDLLLVDAGCSLMDYYNADITRTFPVSGRFSPEQKAIYEIVLEAQESAIAGVAPGKDAESIHQIALRILVEGLIELGLLRGSVQSVIEQGAYQHLYMHRTGHWLGLDVHDVGAYRLGEFSVPLCEGIVMTIEPGIYISDRLAVPEGQPDIEERWKGIGIRIEDDVLVTSSGSEVLTSLASKSVEAITS